MNEATDKTPEKELEAAILEFKRSQRGQIVKFFSFLVLIGIVGFGFVALGLAIGDSVKAVFHVQQDDYNALPNVDVP